MKEHGKIPDATRIMTFDAFVYHMIIRPYEKTIYNFFGQNYKFEKTSITLKKPPSRKDRMLLSDWAMNEEDANEEKTPLDYIFSVEILNEGVDIVEVNQVVIC